MKSLNVGIIGDSWVRSKGINKSLSETINNYGVTNRVYSVGYAGYKSGQIYTELLNDKNGRDLINSSEIDSIIIIAGVNDLICHVGSKYYSENIKNIISLANNNKKFVYVVSLPEFGTDIEEGLLLKAKHFLFKYIFDKGESNAQYQYRNRLDIVLQKSKLDYEIIPYENFVDNYENNKSLYYNSSHLNNDGYKLLGEYIGRYIVRHLSSS